MRPIHTLPLVAAMLLAACGGSDEAATGDGADVSAAAAAMVQPRPGEYRVSLELLEFDIPGLPDAAKQQMRDIYSSGLASHTFCLTPEEAEANGSRRMVQNLADSECTMDRFDVTGGSVVADMQCPMEDGITSRTRMEGQMTTEGSTMTMDSTQTVPGAGETRTRVRITSQRIGDCA